MPQRTDQGATPPSAQSDRYVTVTDEHPKVGDTVLVLVGGAEVFGRYQGLKKPAPPAREPFDWVLWLFIIGVITLIIFVLMQPGPWNAQGSPGPTLISLC
jgi:hypothetical protein